MDSAPLSFVLFTVKVFYVQHPFENVLKGYDKTQNSQFDTWKEVFSVQCSECGKKYHIFSHYSKHFLTI